MIVIGLTGGIGAGKSTITNRLKELEIPVFDCDAEVHRMYEDPEISGQVFEICGLPRNSTRQDVAKAITERPYLLSKFEKIFQDSIEIKFSEFVHNHTTKGFDVVVVDAPLLLENDMDKFCDFVVCVLADQKIRRERVMSRPGMNEEKLNVIMARQLDDQTRIDRSHYCIDNNGSLDQTLSQLDDILKRIKN